MDIVHERCAGLDVHKKTVVACRLVRDVNGRPQHETRTFSTMTQALLELSDWLSEARVTVVAMESTGEYWKPIYNILEGDFELLLVNARHIKMVPGRKTDVGDAHWIADLLQHGLLRASFVPPQKQRAMRELTRHRSTFVRHRAVLSNRIQKVLEGANIKLGSVASDVLGVSGRLIIKSLSEGETRAEVLATLAKGRLADKRKALEQALLGRMQDHQRLVLRELMTQVESLDQSIARFTASIEELCREPDGSDDQGGMGLPSDSPIPSSEPEGVLGSTPDDLAQESNQESNHKLAPLSFQAAVQLLATIPGVARTVSEIVVSEIGTDMSRFPSAGHLASWSGMCPGNHESGGKRLSGRTSPGNQSLKTNLVQSAHCAARSKLTYLAAQYRRIASRRGAKRAALAVAHTILVIIYHMLRDHRPYQDLGYDYFDRINAGSLSKRYVRGLNNLGYKVELTPITVPS